MSDLHAETPPPELTRTRSAMVPLAIAAGTALVLAAGALLAMRARGQTNSVALASAPKPVTVVEAKASTWREQRRYVGTLEPWVAAKVGPQMVSAYVDTVLVRPGTPVQRGQVIATLDCRHASAANQAVSMQARALEASQLALANEASRMSTLLKGGYASPDEVEMKNAESDSKQAQLLALKAQTLAASLGVEDCVLKSPFDGEVAERNADPGAFARPGVPIATVIDRRMVRMTADVSEADFEAVSPGTPVKVHLLATGADLEGAISRRAPAADLSTRTVHVEVDLPNKDRAIPVGTTAELRLEAGKPAPAVEIPLAAATVRGRRANVLVVEKGVAHKRAVEVEGESEGELFIAPDKLLPGSQVILDGRAGVGEGDAVAAHPQQSMPHQAQANRGGELLQ